MVGFVVVLADTLLFFCKFSQKDKVLVFHLLFLLLLLTTGIVALSDSQYLDRMELLRTYPSAALCTANGYLDECLLAPSFLAYRGSFISFFVVYLVFFCGYAAVYHYSVVRVLPLLEKGGEMDGEKGASLEQANRKNETLVSQTWEEEFH